MDTDFRGKEGEECMFNKFVQVLQNCFRSGLIGLSKNFTNGFAN